MLIVIPSPWIRSRIQHPRVATTCTSVKDSANDSPMVWWLKEAQGTEWNKAPPSTF